MISCIEIDPFLYRKKPQSRPGAVPDYCFTVDGRRMLYDVKRISFFPIASQLLPESLLAYGCSGL